MSRFSVTAIVFAVHAGAVAGHVLHHDDPSLAAEQLCHFACRHAPGFVVLLVATRQRRVQSIAVGGGAVAFHDDAEVRAGFDGAGLNRLPKKVATELWRRLSS